MINDIIIIIIYNLNYYYYYFIIITELEYLIFNIYIYNNK